MDACIRRNSVDAAYHLSEFFGGFRLVVHDPMNGYGVDTARKMALQISRVLGIQRKIFEKRKEYIDKNIFKLSVYQLFYKIFSF